MTPKIHSHTHLGIREREMGNPSGADPCSTVFPWMDQQDETSPTQEWGDHATHTGELRTTATKTPWAPHNLLPPPPCRISHTRVLTDAQQWRPILPRRFPTPTEARRSDSFNLLSRTDTNSAARWSRPASKPSTLTREEVYAKMCSKDRGLTPVGHLAGTI